MGMALSSSDYREPGGPSSRGHCGPTLTGQVHRARGGHTATLLRTGQVLVAGGEGLSSAELYDPRTGTWSLTASMSTDRYVATSTLLTTGQVLVVGGQSHMAGGNPPERVLATAERYTP